MKITKRQLRRIIRETLVVEADGQTFSGVEGRWEAVWDPMGKTWELQADGEMVAQGTVEGHPPNHKWLGEKGTDLLSVVKTYRKVNADHWKFNDRPKETTLPENATEGWSIEFSDEEEDDNMDLEVAFDNAGQAMRDEWG
jgi:hypothetical protein